MARKKMEMTPIEYQWQDRRRVLGMPLTFTRYRLSDDRLFLEKGLLNLNTEELLLYRVRDIQLQMSLWQRLFGVGTVCIYSSDKSAPHLDIVNVKQPREVKELIHQSVERAKDKRRMRTMEVMGSDGESVDYHDADDDGGMDGHDDLMDDDDIMD